MPDQHAPSPAPSLAPLIGDHPALDLLNTRSRSAGGEEVDYWQTGEDVLRWLQQAGLHPDTLDPPPAPNQHALLAEARALRELARRLITAQAAGDGSLDCSALNAYLHQHRSAPHIQRDAEGKLAMVRLPCNNDPPTVLGPVAEAVAQLLVDGDFSLVKQCGGAECVLWFYDRTRGGKRRWCSMALCGNRQKVARFRKRAAAAVPPGGTP